MLDVEENKVETMTAEKTYCLNCGQPVPQYEKFCNKCVEECGLVQETSFWKQEDRDYAKERAAYVEQLRQNQSPGTYSSTDEKELALNQTATTGPDGEVFARPASEPEEVLISQGPFQQWPGVKENRHERRKQKVLLRKLMKKTNVSS